MFLLHVREWLSKSDKQSPFTVLRVLTPQTGENVRRILTDSLRRTMAGLMVEAANSADDRTAAGIFQSIIDALKKARSLSELLADHYDGQLPAATPGGLN